MLALDRSNIRALMGTGSNRARIEDVAREAGVARSTAALALREASGCTIKRGKARCGRASKVVQRKPNSSTNEVRQWAPIGLKAVERHDVKVAITREGQRHSRRHGAVFHKDATDVGGERLSIRASDPGAGTVAEEEIDRAKVGRIYREVSLEGTVHGVQGAIVRYLEADPVRGRNRLCLLVESMHQLQVHKCVTQAREGGRDVSHRYWLGP